MPFLIVPKASKSERNKGCEDLPTKLKNWHNHEGRDPNNPKNFIHGKNQTFMQNNHPTVKPLKLLSYLITLGSREGDIVLDPFVGSGTTYLAATQLNRKCIGIELNPEYLEIAKARVKPLLEQTKLV
jgi:site-specific DNA-methyltransferase (adenine-specific)